MWQERLVRCLMLLSASDGVSYYPIAVGSGRCARSRSSSTAVLTLLSSLSIFCLVTADPSGDANTANRALRGASLELSVNLRYHTVQIDRYSPAIYPKTSSPRLFTRAIYRSPTPMGNYGYARFKLSSHRDYSQRLDRRSRLVVVILASPSSVRFANKDCGSSCATAIPLAWLRDQFGIT